MKKIFFLSALLSLSINCSSSDDEVSTSETSTTTTTQSTSTAVKMNVVNAQNVKQPNITVMMFKTKVTTTTNLPTIEKQVVSDSNGLANFDLSSYITSNIAQDYYFEAFKKEGNNYVMISTTHPVISIKKNNQVTTSIVVN